MKTPLTFLLSLTFLFLFSGCVTTPEQIVITSNVSVFHTITEKNKGSKVVVLPFKKELEISLEFQNYKKIIENNLQKNGFNIVQKKDNSDFIAFVSYGTGEGKDKFISSPVFGSTGGWGGNFSGSSYNWGTGGTNWGTYSMPTFGVGGSRTGNIIIYTTQLALDLVETSTLESKKVNKIYEGRVKNTGSCSMIPAVMPEMLESLFKDFPKQSGSTHTISLLWDRTC